MKRIVSIVLVALMMVSLLALGGCGKAEALKFGMAIQGTYGTATDADGETNGKTELTSIGAAVLLDAENKIVQCVIDEVNLAASYTSEGKGVANADLRSKKEKGTDYGMAAYGSDKNGDGVVKEWNEQIAAFIEGIKGKTIDEVKSLVSEGYANEEIQTAGCTIAVSSFVTALESAVLAAADSKATAADTLQLGVSTTEKVTDATAEKDGSAEINTSFTAVALDKDGKVVAAATDVLQATLSYDIKGLAMTDLKTAMKTKGVKGADYGMAAYGTDLNGDGTVKEWNEQAAAFDAALIGKDAAGITALEKDGYGVEDLQTAGCTIAISDMVKAAVKAATVA